MFTVAERKANHGNNNNSSISSDNEDVGALGLSNKDFKKVVEILTNRSNCLYFSKESENLRNIISANPTQKSLMLYLGSKKKTGTGVTGQTPILSSSCGAGLSSTATLGVNDLTSGEGIDGGKKNRPDSKINLLTKLEAEEAALRRLAHIFSRCDPSGDNPLKDDKEAVPSENVWKKLTEKNLEYIFRECVTLDVTNDCVAVHQGRYIPREYGNNVYLMSIKINIRILQRMLLNFPWFCNRLFRVVSGLGIETTASSNVPVAVDDNMSNVWGDVIIKSNIMEDVIPKTLQYLLDEYPYVYEEIMKMSSIRKPSHFIVEFDKVDNGVGLALTEEEHNGYSYFEWRCFNSIRKTQQNDGIGGSRLDNSLGNNSVQAISQHNIAAAADDILSFSKNDFGGGEQNNGIFTGSGIVSETEDAWMRGIFETTYSPQNTGGVNGNQSTYERFRSNEGTASVAQNSSMNFSPITKGEEGRQFVLGMIYFINKSLNDIENPLMCKEKNIFGDDQFDQYATYKELFTAAVCSNPTNVYRVVCDLFVNLVLPRLRNPLANQIENVQTVTGGNGQQRSRIITDYGCVDTQYNNTPPYARGKVRISARQVCECRKMCKEVKCFDKSRQNNQPAHMMVYQKMEEPAFKRNHNSHRCNSYDFRFYDLLRCYINDLKNQGKKKKRNNKTGLTADHDFLLQDRFAFDLLRGCFLSAGLHHIYCPDVFMVHRGDNFNINLQNNKFEGFNENNGVEEVTSFQTVNANEALIDITKNKLRRDESVFKYMQENNMSLRDFSLKSGSVVRQLNALTSQLCNTCNDSNLKPIHIVACIGNYVYNVLPLLEMLLVFVDNEELQKEVIACRNITNTMTCDQILTCPNKLAVYFSLFNFLYKLILRNYNAAVASAYNRRGYLSSISNIVGYRFSNNGDGIKYHETIVSVNSCISYADYFSTRGCGQSDAATIHNEALNIDKTIATMSSQFDSEGKDTKSENNAMKMYASHIFNIFNDDDNSESNSDSDPEHPSTTPVKRKMTDTINEEEQGHQRDNDKQLDEATHTEEPKIKKTKTCSDNNIVVDDDDNHDDCLF
uniref:Wsv285-like protein n=1 Tax=Pasiphaea japonica whispovirus TaxID=2984286 RepID=A0A9C7EZB6_9VIRU|nr:MAG: wsv285-like protein [Pasiphaea japonica whispovirus]